MEPSPRPTPTFILMQRRVLRSRWFVLAGTLLTFFVLDTLKYVFLGHLPREVLIPIDWAIVTLVGLGAALVSARWIRHSLAGAIERERQLQADEHAAAQLAVVQSTARSVAHNLNQPLTAIISYAQQLLETPESERGDRELQQILSEAERVAMLVRQLQQVNRYTTTPSVDGRPMLDLAGHEPRNQLYQ